MGADIHVYLLKRNKDNSFEEVNLYVKDNSGNFHKASVGENRNYSLFAKLAGVRGVEDEMDAGHAGIIDGFKAIEQDEYSNLYFGYKWFSWEELRLVAKYEGMTKYNQDSYGEDEYNIVQEWMNELYVVLDANYIYDTSNIYVQICFDN